MSSARLLAPLKPRSSQRDWRTPRGIGLHSKESSKENGTSGDSGSQGGSYELLKELGKDQREECEERQKDKGHFGLKLIQLFQSLFTINDTFGKFTMNSQGKPKGMGTHDEFQ